MMASRTSEHRASPPWSPVRMLAAVVLSMLVNAGIAGVRRTERRFDGIWSRSLLAITLSSSLTTFVVLRWSMGLEAWYQPRYLIPILGMVLGNALTGISLGLDRLMSDLEDKAPHIEADLAHGATRWEACRPVVRDACRTGLVPILNSMSVVGIVSLPGMMTGQILAGISPLIAVRYQIMIMSVVFIAEFVIALFVKDVIVKPSDTVNTGGKKAFQAGLSFWLLVIATVVSYGALSEIIMGRPLLMDELGFDGKAISGVLIAGGLVSLPMTFLVGWLSDKLGRKTLISICFLLPVPGMALLAFSGLIWQFWLSEILLAFIGIANAVGFAFVTDLVDKESLDTAMSYFGASGWMGTIIGFIFVGYIIDWGGLSITFVSAAIVMFISLLLILAISQGKKKIQPSMP